MTARAANRASDAHRPYVQPIQVATVQWVVRCNCGLYEQFNAQSDANARAAEHARSGS